MKAEKNWQNGIVVCIAPGPSLTLSDCRAVKKANLPTVCVNNAFEKADFCDVVYAGDPGWWQEYFKQVPRQAELWTCLENLAKLYNINCHGPFLSVLNSGLRALQFAIDRGASKVILLSGYG